MRRTSRDIFELRRVSIKDLEVETIKGLLAQILVNT